MKKRIELLNTEREKTDASLVAERNKTNESLSSAKRTTERDTDQSFFKERLLADETTNNSRKDSDSEYTAKQYLTGYTIQDEQKNNHERLNDERERSDKAIELEREQVDSALETERNLRNKLAHLLLSQERKSTDKNLSAERDRSDVEVLHSSGLLNSEIEEHSKTKVTLTTRDEFLAIVSHDLRNPIGAASSCAEMLLDEASARNMDLDTKNWIVFIKRNTDAALRMISDLLDMERIIGGKLELNLEPHNIGVLIKDTIESYSHAASEKSILIRKNQINISTSVIFDRDRVTQILSNLIGNAIKFTPEGGTITISATHKDEEVQVSVSDTGCGIPEEKIGLIFERLAQLKSNDRRGLGLGLYISKMLVEAHSGKLSVDSKVNEGSTFCFSLPLAP